VNLLSNSASSTTKSINGWLSVGLKLNGTKDKNNTKWQKLPFFLPDNDHPRQICDKDINFQSFYYVISSGLIKKCDKQS
jgi:hypothetical protein